jgi:hypothetical protein
MHGTPHQLPGSLFRRLSGGNRSGFPSGFHATTVLGGLLCHKNSTASVLLLLNRVKYFILNAEPRIGAVFNVNG